VGSVPSPVSATAVIKTMGREVTTRARDRIRENRDLAFFIGFISF
jgi:hypothetical protein